MAQALSNVLTAIDEDEEILSDIEAIVDIERLKRIRTSGKMIHTKTGKKLMQSIRVGDDRDTVRALRVNYVRDFDNLEQRHDRYVTCNTPNLSADDLDGEKQWIQAVIYDHQKVLADCDDYLAWTKSKSSASMGSRTSSRHSSLSSRQAKIHEAERREREAELLLQQVADEARRREEEDTKLRDLDDYKRRVESDRKQRELRDEVDRQRLNGAIMRQQLAQTIVDEPSGPTRGSSVVSAVSGSQSSLPPSFLPYLTVVSGQIRNMPTVNTESSILAT